MMNAITIKAFQWIAIAEGISFLLILFVTMPLKYLAEMPQPNYLVGMFHGILFIAYVGGAVLVRSKLAWSNKETLFALLASLLPFATFWVESKLVRKKLA